MNQPRHAPNKPVFISVPKIPIAELVHEDPRRSIREAEKIDKTGKVIGRITIIDVKESPDAHEMVLGNHYHDRDERFTIVSGNPTVLTSNINDPAGEIHMEGYPDGGFRTMAPGEAHTFIFRGMGALIATMDASFEDGGLHAHKLH